MSPLSPARLAVRALARRLSAGAFGASMWLGCALVSMVSVHAGAPPKGQVIEDSSADARVDWTRGLIVAAGQAAADLRAPSPDVARVKAEREARDVARARLEARARALLAAQGADADADSAAQRALAHVVELQVGYGSDGSAVVELGLAIESLRVALRGAATQDAVAPDAVVHPTVVVDARGVLERPVIDVRLAAQGGAFAGPTVFHRSVELALADPRVGDAALGVRALEAREEGGATTLVIDASDGATRVHGPATRGARRAARAASLDQLGPSVASGALVIIVIGKGT